MKKNKKNKRKIIIIAVIIFIIILLILGFYLRNKNISNSSNSINTSFQTIEDIITFYESKYIKQENSKVEGYDLDIYVGFKYNLFEGNESKENFFKMVIESITKFEDFKNIRLIDEEKNIIIEVNCNKDSKSIINILYNGNTDYFKKEISNRSYNNKLEVKTINPDINSEILVQAINQNWISKNINFGTQESTLDKYNIYFDEGYKVRNVQGNIHNIIFTKKYNQEIIAGIKVGDNFSEIKRKLGESYENISNTILGYKTPNFYIFFNEDEISVYPNPKYNFQEFENLVDEYNEKNDVIDFMDKLTGLWPDYDYYNYDSSYIDICYTLKGVKITYNVDEKSGIRIYENYQGTLKNTKTDSQNIIYQLDKNLMLEQEEGRVAGDNLFNDESKKETMKYSSKFLFRPLESTLNGFYKNIQIISLDDNYPDNEFDESIEISDFIWIDDFNLIYSRPGNGIYKYNAELRTVETIVQGEETFEIKEYNKETKTLYYDENKIIVD